MKLVNLTKSYNNRILFSNFNAEFNNGIVEIRGRSGSGKTTLLKIILGIERIDSGEVINEYNSFSYYGKNNYLVEHLSINKNIEILNSSNFDMNLFNEILNKFNLNRLVNKPLYLLSGGERAKLSIALTLSKKADFYALDEPFASIDDKSKIILVDILNNLKKNNLIILTNHSDNSDLLESNYLISFLDNEIKFIIKNDNNKFKNINNKNIKLNYKNTILKLFYREFLLKNKLDLIVKFILICSTFLSLFFSISFLNIKSDFTNSVISAKNDNFYYHNLKTNSKEEIKDNIFNSNFNKYELLKLDTNINPIYVVSSNKINDKVYCYDLKKNIFSLNQDIFINQNKYEFILINENNDLLKKDYSYEIKELIDSKEIILFTNNKIFDELIVNKNNNFFNLSKDSLPIFKYLPEIKYINDYSKEEYFDVSTLSKDMKIIKSEARYFKSPYINSKIGILGNINGEIEDINRIFNISTNIFKSEDNNILIGIETYKDFLFHLDEKIYSIAISNDEIKNIDKNYFTLKKNIIYYKDFQKTNFMISIIIFSLSFILLLIYLLSTKNKMKNRYNHFKNILEYNCILNIYNKLFTTIIIIKNLIILSLFSLLYLYILLPYVNYLNMVEVYKIPIVEGINNLYYYSKQPLNNYFDSITSPIKFHTFSNLYYIFIIILILLTIYELFVLINLKKGVHHEKIKYKNRSN